MLSDENLNNLENKVSNELKKINYWLKNKLSLNYTKTNYILINKRPNISCIDEFQLQLNKASLKKEHSVTFLRIILDEKLKWCNQIQHLPLQLARYSGLFYKICNSLSRQMLRMLYHSLIYSKLQYSILLWGTASQTHPRKLMFRLNTTIRIIFFSKNRSPKSNLYKSLYLLKLTDIYKREFVKFMFALHNNRSLKIFMTRSPN